MPNDKERGWLWEIVTFVVYSTAVSQCRHVLLLKWHKLHMDGRMVWVEGWRRKRQNFQLQFTVGEASVVSATSGSSSALPTQWNWFHRSFRLNGIRLLEVFLYSRSSVLSPLRRVIKSSPTKYPRCVPWRRRRRNFWPGWRITSQAVLFVKKEGRPKRRGAHVPSSSSFFPHFRYICPTHTWI